MDDGYQYFKNKPIQKSSQCHMLDFDEWMKVMLTCHYDCNTKGVAEQLKWSCCDGIAIKLQ